MTINPYESPVDAQLIETGNDAIRMKYFKHERAVKSISVLYYAGAIVLFVMAAFMLFMDERVEVRAAFFGIGVLVGACYFALGQGLRNLRPWARPITSLLTLPGVFGFPLGTLIALYILYLLLSPKGKFVFSGEYAQIRAATPHLDKMERTSPIVLFFFFLLLGVFGLALIGALITYFAAQNSV